MVPNDLVQVRNGTRQAFSAGAKLTGDGPQEYND